MTLNNVDPTILKSDKNYVLVNYENHALCDIYIVEFVHDATENYYEIGKYGCRNFHVTKIPLFILKVSKLLLFYLPMLVTMWFFDLFSYNIPMHRKWVRLKCVLYILLDALFCFISYFHVSIFWNYWAYLNGYKESACGRQPTLFSLWFLMFSSVSLSLGSCYLCSNRSLSFLFCFCAKSNLYLRESAACCPETDFWAATKKFISLSQNVRKLWKKSGACPRLLSNFH